MNVLGNLQSLKEKNFWPSIANSEIESIWLSIIQWMEEQKRSNDMVQFFFNYLILITLREIYVFIIKI